MQGVLKKQKGVENIDRNARVKQDHLPFVSYVDTNLYEKLNNRNPLMKSNFYGKIHKSQMTNHKQS